MDNIEKNRILKLHKKELISEQGKGGGKYATRGGTGSSSAGQFDGAAFKGDGILTTSGRQEDIGKLPDVVDLTKGSDGITFDLTNDFGGDDKGSGDVGGLSGLKDLPGKDEVWGTPPQPLGNEVWAGPPGQINSGNVWLTANGEIIDITGLTIQEVFELLEDLQLYPGKQVGTFLTGIQIFTHIYDTYGGEIAGEIRNCIESGGGNACLTMIFNLFPPPGTAFLMGPDSSTEDALDNPLSLSCCKKCDNGRYTNKCFPLDGDEDCTFPTLEVCEDETDTKMPSLSNIFSL